MINIENKKDCCGCSACKNICPVNAIKMIEDDEGFLYPKVNMSNCINCGKCEKVCPIKKNNKKNFIKGYVIQNKDNDILSKASSGGFFYALSKYIIKKGGYSVGVMYDKNWHPVYKMTCDEKELTKFMGSKYSQCDASHLYPIIKNKLDENKKIVFSGTPCQVAGLKSYLGNNINNLILVDLVCRSIPSTKFWNHYINMLEEKYDSKIKSVNQRDKEMGYHHGILKVCFENNKIYKGSVKTDIFSNAFHNDICSRPSCYDCKFKNINRCSDFTMFDSWYPSKLNIKIHDNDRGYTNILIQSTTGQQIFNEIKDSFYYEIIEPEDAIEFTGGMVTNSISWTKKRDEFYTILNNQGIDGLFKNNIIKIKKLDVFTFKLKQMLNLIGILKYIRR